LSFVYCRTVVEDDLCEGSAAQQVTSRPCNAFVCGLSKLELTFDVESPYVEVAWSLSTFDAFEAVLRLEMQRLAAAAGEAVDVEVVQVAPSVVLTGCAGCTVGDAFRVSVVLTGPGIDADTLLAALLSDLESASADAGFFGNAANTYYYLKSVSSGTMSGQVIDTQYCVGNDKCSNLHRLSCSDSFGECGPCREGFLVGASSDDVLSAADGLLQCFPPVECAYATPDYCATSLFRQPCSRTPNTCGPCLPGFDGINPHGDGNQVCDPVSVDCSAADEQLCASLLRMPCQNTHNTCGPCVPVLPSDLSSHLPS
jgi:hypothetical protein